MGNKKQFDEEKVLSAIADYFWKHGYIATKVDKLSVLTGLTKTSLYNAFGNKESLFNKAIDYYAEQQLAQLFSLLDMNKTMSENISVILHELFSVNQNERLRYGCLVTNSIVELAGDEQKLHAIANKHLDKLKVGIFEFFAHYQSNEKLINNTDINKLTDFFITNLQGLRVQSRISEPNTTLSNSIELLSSYFTALEVN